MYRVGQFSGGAVHFPFQGIRRRNQRIQASINSCSPCTPQFSKNHRKSTKINSIQTDGYSMSDAIALSIADASDIPEIHKLVISVFDEFVGVDYGAEGSRTFHDFASEDSLRSRSDHIRIIAKNSMGKIVGVTEGWGFGYIRLFFVDKEYHGRGIGRMMLNEYIKMGSEEDGGVEKIKLFSSPFAMKVYQKLGFEIAGDAIEKDGIFCTPMELDLTRN